jgi:hypothetical protein
MIIIIAVFLYEADFPDFSYLQNSYAGNPWFRGPSSAVYCIEVIQWRVICGIRY